MMLAMLCRERCNGIGSAVSGRTLSIKKFPKIPAHIPILREGACCWSQLTAGKFKSI